MARSKQTLRARVSRAAGRGRKQPSSPVERAFEEVKQLVSGTSDRFFGESGQKKKSGAGRTRSGRQRQAEAKKAGASRIRSGQQRQAAAKKAARKRGLKTT